MGKFYFLSFFIFLSVLSCQKETKPGKPEITDRQKQIISEFHKLERILRQNADSVEKLSGRMQKLSKDETVEFRAMANIVRASAEFARARYEPSFEIFYATERELRSSKADTLRARALLGIGNYYKVTGDYPKALNNMFSALKIFEKRDQKRGISVANSSIGQVFMQQNDMKLATEHLERAMSICGKRKANWGYLSAAHTLANVNGIQGKYKEALALDEMAIPITDSIGAPKIKSMFLDNKANCYMFMGRLDSARYYFNECLKIDIASGDEKQIADSYSNLGAIDNELGNLALAEAETLKSIDMLGEIDSKHNVLKSYKILGQIYERSGQPAKALEAYKKYQETYEELMSEKKEAALAESKVVYETEKKEKIIAENRLKLLEKEREVDNRNTMLVVVSMLAFFVALIGFLIYRQQKLRNRQQEQEHELKTAIARVETQNKLQQQRLDISRDLHDNIGAQLTFIISSVDNIRYAFDISDTKLESKLQGINSFAKATILELRDTIWAMNASEISLEELRSRIFNFIEKARDAREDIGFKFTIATELQDLRFSSLTGMNLYRVVQEAVNNGIKYSGAANIGIHIGAEDNGLSIRIEDDGKGFDLDSAEGGNGLRNMRKRMDELGGAIDIRSETGKGTVISIRLSCTPKPSE